MTPDQLTDTTAFLFNVSRTDLFGSSRVARIAEARQVLAWALRQSNWSLESIGAYLHRDHTTIIYALKNVERRAQHNLRFAERLKVLSEQYVESPTSVATQVKVLDRRVAELEAQIEQLQADIRRRP